MRNIQKIILFFALAYGGLNAAELIRPKMELIPVRNGVQVILDFQQIEDSQWCTMLAHPESFQQFGYGVAGAPGEAALPMLTVMIPVKAIHNIQVTAIEEVSQTLSDPHLKSTPAGHLDSDQQSVNVNDFNWEDAVRSQVDEIQLGELVNMKGQEYLPVTLHPMQLDAVSHNVRVVRTLEFKLLGLEFSDEIPLVEDGGIRSISVPSDQFVPKGHYLIITPPMFELYIQYFADWKLQQGYTVSVVNTGTTGSSAASIQNYLQNAWDTWEDRPDFLVLVGDEDQGIPGHYIQNPQGENLVTDHPYAMLEGDDSFPELMVGRLSVDTISELISFTSKIVAYERNPYMSNTEWYQRALMISTTWGAASAQATKEWVAEKLLENDFTQIYTAYHPQQSSTSYIANPINEGVAYVNYRGFGMYNGWYGPDFTNGDIENLINNGPRTPVITSVVCGGGNFAATVDPCFGEEWTRIGTVNNPKGAVAFFGPSELYTHTQFNNVIDIGIYSGIFDLGITTLGEALWHGKFELWRNYYQNTYFPFGQTPEFYHHIYNLLGDPGMQLWTSVPKLLTVDHVDTLTSGDNALLVSVGNAVGEPLAGAYVALYNAENAVGGTTDINGQIQLPFEAGEAPNIQLTITGKNLFPYLATLPIINREHALELLDWTLNNSQLLISGESCPMQISMFNAGSALSDVHLTFTSTTPGISINESITVPSIPAQDQFILDPVNLSATSGLPQGYPIVVDLTIETAEETWTWYQNFMVQAVDLQVNALNVESGTVSAGDSVEVSIELVNQGGTGTGPISITPMEHDLLQFDYESLICPALEVDEVGSTDNFLEIVFNDQIFPGETLELAFECTQGGQVDTLNYLLKVGDVDRYAPSLPDAYGYRMFDDYDLGYSKAQAYEWIELDPAQGGSGIQISMSDTQEEGDESRTINLPFPVNYYGMTYDRITICTNGWAAFGEQSVVNFHNRTIPSPVGPTAMLAPYWDDLVTNPGTIWQQATPGSDRFIIEWNRMRNLGQSNDLSFQIIIFNAETTPTASGDSDIKFQYKSYENSDIAGNFSTIGIESPDTQIGVLASYNNYNDPSLQVLENHTALLFSTDRGERLADAVVAISTTSLSFTQNPWSTGQDSIIIINAGEAPLAYNFQIDSDSDMLPPAPAMQDQHLTKADADGPDPVSASREGSDAYGYTWTISSEPEGPVYNWIDIVQPANHLAYQDDPDDGCIGPIALGFEFPFYDDVFSEMFISSNGSISFMGSYSPWSNTFLPSTSAPPALLAPWWDDLNNETGGAQGSIFFWTNENDQCVITWKDFPKWGTSDFYTFQVVLERFGKIIYQYQTMDGPIYSSTIGQQNADRNIGLQIRYNDAETPFEEETAIVVNRPVPWFSAVGWSGLIEPGEQSVFRVNVQTQNLDPGHYEVPLMLSTSAQNLPQTQVMVSMDITLGQPPSGDINGDYLIDINDLMNLLDFVLSIEEMNEDQFALADLSADQEVDVIDVIILLELLLTDG